jgi:hypothetical protein
MIVKKIPVITEPVLVCHAFAIIDDGVGKKIKRHSHDQHGQET